MTETILSVQNLGFYYDAPYWIFQRLNFELKKGEILAILGPNGCGKSTLLDILLNIHAPSAGSVRSEQSFAFVPQSFFAPFAYTAFDIVLMGRAPHISTFSQPSRTDKQAALNALEELGLAAFADKNFSLLSGGQQQLVLIARAIATELPLILLDEPSSALDLYNQNDLLTLLRRLAQKRSMTIIFTTHQPNHAAAIADKTLLMTKPDILFGRTEQILTVENLARLFRIRIQAQHIHCLKARCRQFLPLYDVLFKQTPE